jgi:hypothetical protein
MGASMHESSMYQSSMLQSNMYQSANMFQSSMYQSANMFQSANMYQSANMFQSAKMYEGAGSGSGYGSFVPLPLLQELACLHHPRNAEGRNGANQGQRCANEGPAVLVELLSEAQTGAGGGSNSATLVGVDVDGAAFGTSDGDLAFGWIGDLCRGMQVFPLNVS